MFANLLPIAVFISLSLHTVFLVGTMLMHVPKPQNAMTMRRMEVDYKPQPKKKQVDVKQHPIKPAQRLDLNNAMITGEGTIPLKLSRDNETLSNNFVTDERRPEQIRSAQMAHRISIVPIKSDKINSPAYTSYNEMVRSRIEEKVYGNYRKMEEGVVYLTFIIASDGSLKAAQIIEDKTQGSAGLKDVSLSSLKQAVFPPFIKGMTLPEYTFNIEIQYQVRE